MEKSLCLHSAAIRSLSLALPEESPTAPARPSPGRRTPLWLWPHVLSLEAPLVAVLWLLALARQSHFSLMPGVVAGLAVTVWMIYVADRLLDAWGKPAGELSLRHRFYQKWRWVFLAGVLPVAFVYLVWLALWVVPVGLLAHVAVQVLPVLLYLVLYSVISPSLRRRLLMAGVFLLLVFLNVLPLPFATRLAVSMLVAGALLTLFSLNLQERVGLYFRKEVAAGLLFAFGCTTWNRFLSMGGTGAGVWAELVLLGLLFVANLALINARENPQDAQAGRRVWGTLAGALVMCGAALVAMPLGYLPTALLPVVVAVISGLLALAALARLAAARPHFSAEAFRVWADLLVAAPAAVLWLWPEGSATAVTEACCIM